MAPQRPAVAEVLQTAELLEQILSDLSIDRLLILKRVSRLWSAVIATSPVLQRTLYLRPKSTRSPRDHNPLFEDFFSDIGYPQTVPPPSLPSPSSPSPSPSSLPPPAPAPTPPSDRPAHLKLSPTQMRKLLHGCPPALRAMGMFQPPCRYWLTLPNASPWEFTVKFLNEADVPVVRAVEMANRTVELEAEKRRNLRRNLEYQLRPGVRGAGMRHRQQGGNAGAVNA